MDFILFMQPKYIFFLVINLPFYQETWILHQIIMYYYKVKLQAKITIDPTFTPSPPSLLYERTDQ